MRAGMCGANETRAVGGYCFQFFCRARVLARRSSFLMILYNRVRDSIVSRFTVLEEVQIDVRPGRYSEYVCPVAKVGPVARIVV